MLKNDREDIRDTKERIVFEQQNDMESRYIKKKASLAVVKGSLPNSHQIARASVLHVKNAIINIKNGIDIALNLKIFWQKANAVKFETINQLTIGMPYDLIKEMYINNDSDEDRYAALNCLSILSSTDSFSPVFMEDSGFFSRLEDDMITGDNEKRSVVFNLLSPLVRSNCTIRDYLMNKNILRLLNVNSIPKGGIRLMMSLILCEPVLPQELIIQIFVQIRSCLYTSSSTAIEYFFNCMIDFPSELICSSVSEILRGIVEEFLDTKEISVARGVIQFLAHFVLLDGLVSVIIHSIEVINDKDFLSWVVSYIINSKSLFSQEILQIFCEKTMQKAECGDYFFGKISTLLLFSIQDKEYLISDQSIDLLIKYSTDEEIGLHSIAKLITILNYETDISLKELLIQKCAPILENIEQVGYHSKGQQIEELFIQTIEKISADFKKK